MTYDYLIVGAGSAGCVLANRLSASGAFSVALIEAGGSDRHPFIRMPSAFSLPIGSARFDWRFAARAEARLADRALACPRGKVLGGSSSINGMVYVRGNPLDYERWERLGAAGWGYAQVLPYFRRSETALGAAHDDPYRGHDGPLQVSRGERANPLYDAFLEAAEQAGHQLNDDLNGARQEGFGPLEMTVAGGIRCSAARAYLQPARRRKNLTVHTGALAQALLFDGERCTGVRVRRSGSRPGSGHTDLHARREVLLAAGAIGSPQLLQCSGIGPQAALAQAGVDLRADVPEVGANLMDHLEVYLQQGSTPGVSLNRHLSLFGKGLIGARWLLRRDGLGATNHFEVGGFTRSSADQPWPDIQYHFLPAAVSYDGSRAAAGHGFQVHVGPMLSPSRGTLTIRSADTAVPPLLDFNYMSDPQDWQVFRAAIRQARDIFAQSALTPYRTQELAPGETVSSDDALDAFVSAHAESAYHPCGTCRMGSDHRAVVDPQCRVQGVTALRVIDASVFPHITNGNLNGPTIMLAERAADLVLETSLPRDPLPYYTADT
ncbi:MAG: choline dehydrogenase [Pseudomonadota bacterium]